MSKKLLLLIGFLFFTQGCSSLKKEDPFFLTNLNMLYPISSLNNSEANLLNQMLNSLTTFVNVESLKKPEIDFDKYNSETLSALNKIISGLKLHITFSDANIIVLSSSKESLQKAVKATKDKEEFLGSNASAILIPVMLPQNKKGEKSLISNTNDIRYYYEGNTVYGYQSLYPKSPIVSLLYMLKNIQEKNDNPSLNVEIMIIKSNENVQKNITDFTKTYGDPYITLSVDGVYPYVKSIKGKVKFILKMKKPDWLLDVTTKKDSSSTLNDLTTISYKKSGQTKNEEFDFGVSNPLFKEEIAEKSKQQPFEILTRIDEIAKSEGAYHETDELFHNILFLLKTCGKGWKLSQGFMDNIAISNISTTNGNIVIEMNAELIDESDNFTQDLKDFFEKASITKIEGSKNSLAVDLSIDKYISSYNFEKGTEVQKSTLQKAQNVYHTLYATNKTPATLFSNYKSLATYFTNSVIVGASYNTFTFYNQVNFVPEVKLLKDYEFYLNMVKEIQNSKK